MIELLWKNSGNPEHKFKKAEHSGLCACCGCEIRNSGVCTADIISEAFSRHSEFISIGTHVCDACAWMFSYPKESHRNVLAVGDSAYWPMIGHDSATLERPSWLDLLRSLKNEQEGTRAWGVMTVDPKPRLWPMSHEVTLGDFGLYLHWPDYDLSEFVRFDLYECLEIAEFITSLMQKGFSKRACFFSVVSDMKKAKKDLSFVLEAEKKLKIFRKSSAFMPALMIAGVKKQENNIL
jgi:hypothetical protein